MIPITPVYNFIELGLEEYEENEMVLDVVHDLVTFFSDTANCTCRRSPNKRDIRTCFEKVGFKHFFERYMELKGLEKDMKDLCIKTQLMTFELVNENSTKFISTPIVFKNFQATILGLPGIIYNKVYN